MNHNWSATKQRLHPQSVAKISRHSVLSGDRIRQCGTLSGSHHKDTVSHRSVLFRAKNSSAETTIAEGGQNLVVGLWDHTLGENWPPEPTSSYASIDFWCQLVASLATIASWMSVVAMVGWIGQLSWSHTRWELTTWQAGIVDDRCKLMARDWTDE